MHKDFTDNDSISDGSFYIQAPRLYLRRKYIIRAERPGPRAGLGPELPVTQLERCLYTVFVPGTVSGVVQGSIARVVQYRAV